MVLISFNRATERLFVGQDTLKTVDLFAKNLQDALEVRNLTEIVDVIFVSDHGMTDTSNPEWVYIDDYLGKQALDFLEHEDGWPSMGLRFSPEANTTAYLGILLEAAKNNREKFDVRTRRCRGVTITHIPQGSRRFASSQSMDTL